MLNDSTRAEMPHSQVGQGTNFAERAISYQLSAISHNKKLKAEGRSRARWLNPTAIRCQKLRHLMQQWHHVW